ncbi:tRNA methyl transferase PRC-barrel domain-containing protein, partial [Candidatus Phytoplasma asteris]|uniref:tRNA methyl transferase PRC-barrel domain-containing protein n=1 Tax=Candidatus Phytoplasma asteris TaxID=85620 RepID=UPI0039E1974D
TLDGTFLAHHKGVMYYTIGQRKNLGLGDVPSQKPWFVVGKHLPTNTLKGIERNMECVFITGMSGSGKTTLAKKIAKDKNYQTYISSGSNDVLDDYQGQECIILDDLRSNCLGLTDLLKMLDNNTS